MIITKRKLEIVEILVCDVCKKEGEAGNYQAAKTVNEAIGRPLIEVGKRAFHEDCLDTLLNKHIQ